MNGTDWAELQAKLQAERDARDAARMRHEARRHTYAVHYPSRAFRIEANWDAEYGAEWALSEAALLADENATLTAQLANYATTKERLTTERILLDDARREIAALRAENATLCEKLDAANAKLAALENAALVAESATPATLGDKPRKVWTEDVKRAILTALVEEPRNLSEMRADGWMAEVPDRQFAACILEMSRTWQLMRPVPGAPEGTYELTPAGAGTARAMLADADDDMPATLGDRRQQETRSIEWTPPTRSKPDAAA